MQRNFFLWLSSFISFRFSGFPLTPLTFQSLLCKLYLFLFLVYFYIFFPSFFLLLFHRFSRLTCWSALIAISHDICTIFVCLQSQLPGTVSCVAQAARRVLSTDLVSPLSPSPSSSLSLSLLFIYNIFLFKMKPQATPNYWWQNMLHKSSAAASACSLPSPPAGATPLWQIPFPASVLSPAQSQPVPISNPLASPLPLLAFFISFALFCHFSLLSPHLPPPLSHS